jgi:hypothetical protein
MVRRERAQWRLSAVLLSLVLAIGAAMYHVAGPDRTGLADAQHSPSAVMATNGAATSQTAGERQPQTRLVANRGQGAALLFVVAVAALLAGLRRPHSWSLTASLAWWMPAAVGASASRGRAPPAPLGSA